MEVLYSISNNKDYISHNIDVKLFLDQRKKKQNSKIAIVVEDIKQGKSLKEIDEKNPTSVLLMKEKIINYMDLHRQFQLEEEEKEEFKKARLRTWQNSAWIHLKNQNDRQVLWIVDEKGGKGKTYFAKWLEVVHGAFYIQNGKSQDIAKAYTGQKIVAIDFTRDYREYINYSVIESFKNGRIFSSKYDSHMKKMKFCQVICFSNFQPELEKLSEDRWNIQTL